jgi:hypothetical protein
MAKEKKPNYQKAAGEGLSTFKTLWESNNPGFARGDAEKQFQLYGGDTSTTSSGFSSLFSNQSNDDLGKTTGIGSKIVNKILGFVNETVKFTANVGGNLLDTQIGKGNSNYSTSKKIFDVFAEGGLNPIKLFKEGGGAIYEAGIEQLKQESVLLSEINTKTGISGDLSDALRKNMIDVSVSAKQFGFTLEEVGEIYKTLVERSGKFSLINSETYDNMGALAASLDMSLETLTDSLSSFEEIGYGLDKSKEGLDDVLHSSLNLGLSAKKITSDVTSNISKLNEYGFSKGIAGLKEMAIKSTELRMSMQSTFNLAQKVMDMDGAIDLVANMQMVGGAIGAFNDPLRLMYMAVNDVEGLQDALIGAASGLATYNAEQGKFEVTGINRRRAMEMEKITGQKYDEIIKMSIADAERKQALNALMAAPVKFDDQTAKEDKEFLTNLARMKDGKMQILIPKDLQEQFKTGESGIVDLTKLSQGQYETFKELKGKFEKLSTEDIANSQLTELEKMSRGIDVMASWAVVESAAWLRRQGKNILGDQIKSLQATMDKFNKKLIPKKTDENKNINEKSNETAAKIRENEKLKTENKNKSNAETNTKIIYEVNITSDNATETLRKDMSRNIAEHVDFLYISDEREFHSGKRFKK